MSKLAGKLKDVDYTQPESYESDGAELATGIVKGEMLVEKPSEDISTEAQPVADAFNVFAAKTGRQKEETYDVYSKQTMAEKGEQPPKETLYQRYYRLREEVKELVHDAESAAAGGKHKPGTVPKAEDLTELSTQLDALSTTDKTRMFVDADFALSQAHGARTVAMNRLEDLIDTMTGTSASDAAAKPEGTSVTKTQGDKSHELTYELFLDRSVRSTVEGSAVAHRCAELEKRITDLEQLLGPQVGADNQALLGDTLCAEIARISERLESLTPEAIHTVSMRAATATAQLKALQAEKKKLKSTQSTPTGPSATTNTAEGSTEPGAADDDEQKLNQLYGMMERWDAAATELPVVIERLQALKGLHEEAAQFTQMIHAIQAEQETVQSLLTSHQEALNKCESSVVEQATTFKDNMAVLHEQLESLEKSRRK